MYHLPWFVPSRQKPQTKNRKSISHLNRSALAAIISLVTWASTGHIPAQASPSRLTSNFSKNHQNRLLASTFNENYELVPVAKRLKKRPTDVQMFQLDKAPLGDRSPFLMVHGLRGEYAAGFRWHKLSEYLKKSEDFNSRYKIYMVRYSSLDRTDFNLQNFKDAFNHLYEAGKRRPITIMALSVGGQSGHYEAMTDKDIDSKTNSLFTLGTPFHGSPLFDKEWLDYSVYKRFSWPWTRVERNLTYDFYFNDNKQLRQDFGWDNVDNGIPDAGPFKSKLPFGPKGTLTAANTMNERLARVNSAVVDKQKLITYSGYMTNPYLVSRDERIVESAFLYPYFVLFTSFPAHFGREHAALGLINKDMCCVQTTKEVAQKAGEPFVYILNDGICPVTSAIFTPPALAKEQYLARESDIEKTERQVRCRPGPRISRCRSPDLYWQRSKNKSCGNTHPSKRRTTSGRADQGHV